MKERSFHREEENRRRGVHAYLDSNERGCRHGIYVMSCAECACRMDDEFLNQIGAVCDAGKEGCSGNCDPPKRQSWTYSANEQRRHPNCNQWKLPDAGSNCEVFAFTQPKRVTDQPERGQPDPRRKVCQALPPAWSEFFDRGKSNTKHKRIEPGPGWIINPGLETAKGNSHLGEILKRKDRAKRDSAQNDDAGNGHGRARAGI